MRISDWSSDVCSSDLPAAHLDAVGRYPDVTDATRALAEATGVDQDRLVLTNAGSEAITLVAGALGGSVAAEPEFSLHPRAADGSGPLWRSHPHSPTGAPAAADQPARGRSEERRVGTEGVSTVESRESPSLIK